MDLTVAVIGAAHGLRGEVALDVRTDSPHERFCGGAVFRTDPDVGELTLVGVRPHGPKLLAQFKEVVDRTGAETLRGTRLLIGREDAPDEDDAWYEDDLLGLRVCSADGELYGTVTGLVIGTAHDLLEIEYEGRSVLIPFVKQIVTDVDVENETVTVDAPDGLFESQ